MLVTHYQRLLDHVVPDLVHVLARGRIVRSGDRTLALELERRGYDWVSGPGGLRISMSAPSVHDPRLEQLERVLRDFEASPRICRTSGVSRAARARAAEHWSARLALAPR